MGGWGVGEALSGSALARKLSWLSQADSQLPTSLFHYCGAPVGPWNGRGVCGGGGGRTGPEPYRSRQLGGGGAAESPTRSRESEELSRLSLRNLVKRTARISASHL